MEYVNNFRRIVLFAMGALALMVSVHQAALLYGTSPGVAAAYAATVAVAFTAVAFAVIALAAFATTTTATFATVLAFATTTLTAVLSLPLPLALTTLAATAATLVLAVIALAAATAATQEYRLKYWWVVLVLGIEGAAIYTALTISGVAGLGAIIGLVGIGLLGGLWLLTPHLHLATQKLGG